MMNHRILIVAPFVFLPGEAGYNRFIHLADILHSQGWRVTLVTSQFSHYLKVQRNPASAPWDLVMLPEPGYRRNISFARFLSHKRFAARLANWLDGHVGDYSVVYSAVPLISAANVAGRFASRCGVPFVLDVQDIWPDAFSVAIPGLPSGMRDVLVRLVGWREEALNRATFPLADRVFAVSETYMNWALSKGARAGSVYYIGADLSIVDRNAALEPKPPGEHWITYVGTLSHSYDIRTLLDAMAILQKGRRRTGLVCNIVGEGPLGDRFRSYEAQLGVGAKFLGTQPYEKVMSLLRESDVGVNAIVGASKTSLPNKVFDYMAAGLPIVNSVKGELAQKLALYGSGIQYQSGDPESLANAIDLLVCNRELQQQMRAGSRRMARDLADRNLTYSRLVEELSGLTDARLRELRTEQAVTDRWGMAKRLILKRALDVLVALMATICTAPVMVVTALLVGVTMGKPILFRQDRPGLNGKPFTMLKFRTMHNRTDNRGEPLPDEERMCPLGKFLRSTSLDELPELVNVLRGDMSIVGPRPLLVEYLSRYNPEQARRHEVRPGITGWAQIHGRNGLSWEEKFGLDVWYVDHWSFWLDIKIMLMTIWRVITHEGVSAEGHATMPVFRGSQAER